MDGDIDFGQMFKAPLVNTTVTTFQLPIGSGPAKILLVSDTHLGGSERVPMAKAINDFIAALKDVVNAEGGITHICHLGDLVDGRIPNGHVQLKEVLGKMAEFNMPVYAIGGNHDREFFDDLSWPGDPNVTPIKELAMLIEYNGQKIYLAHDLANNYRVRDLARSFNSWLKRGCKLRPEDWLVTGHCHVGLICGSSKVSCVGQFSPEINQFGYSILELNPDGMMITNKHPMGKK